MLKLLGALSFALSVVCSFASRAEASNGPVVIVQEGGDDCVSRACGHGHSHRYDEEHSSPFRFASRGLFAGAFAGLGVGYLVAREGDGGLQDDGWRALVFGTGVGALSGAGLGLTLGLLASGGGLVADHVTRDMLYGVSFGALSGTIAGGLSAVLGGQAAHVPLGAAIGAVAGVGLGALTGVLYGQRVARAREKRARSWSLLPSAGPHMAGAVALGAFLRVNAITGGEHARRAKGRLSVAPIRARCAALADEPTWTQPGAILSR